MAVCTWVTTDREFSDVTLPLIYMLNQTEDHDDTSVQRMSSFLQRMQPGKGPTEQLMLELAVLGGLISRLQDLMKRISDLEVHVLVTVYAAHQRGAVQYLVHETLYTVNRKNAKMFCHIFDETS